jgi:hypothetical protein
LLYTIYSITFWIFFLICENKICNFFYIQSIEIYTNSTFVLVFYFQLMKKTYFVKTNFETPKNMVNFSSQIKIGKKNYVEKLWTNLYIDRSYLVYANVFELHQCFVTLFNWCLFHLVLHVKSIISYTSITIKYTNYWNHIKIHIYYY